MIPFPPLTTLSPFKALFNFLLTISRLAIFFTNPVKKALPEALIALYIHKTGLNNDVNLFKLPFLSNSSFFNLL